MKKAVAQKPAAKAGKPIVPKFKIDEVLDLQETASRDPGAFSIVLDGDSMEPEFKAGDRIVLEPNRTARNGDAVLFKLKDGRVLFKWFAGEDADGELVFSSENQDKYSAFSVPKKDVKFIYPAREFMRKIKGSPWFTTKLPAPIMRQLIDGAKTCGVPLEQFTLEAFRRMLPELQARLGKKATA